MAVVNVSVFIWCGVGNYSEAAYEQNAVTFGIPWCSIIQAN